jgi:hypothetical protein
MQSKVNLIQHYIAKLMNEPKYAWAATIPFSCFDAMSWIPLMILMILILRQGVKSTWNLMCANFVVHGLAIYYKEPSVYSWVNAFLDYIPGFLSAIVLMYMRSWLWVTYALISFSGMCALGIAILIPDYALSQIHQTITAAKSLNLSLPIGSLELFIRQYQDFSVHMLLGLQMLSAVFNASINLMMARSLQAQMFNPGGFEQEMLNIRGSRALLGISLVSMILVFALNRFLPLYILPTLMFYFFGVGMSIGVSVLLRQDILAFFKRSRSQVLTLGLGLASFVLPYFFIPTFILIGALDSVMNFRSLLIKRVKPTI